MRRNKISYPLKYGTLSFAFRHLPIPGRYLEPALRASGMANMPMTGIVCMDRWNQFQVEINNSMDIIERHILFQGYFEYRESKLLRRTLQKGDTFVDIGANIGWHTLLAASRVGFEGKVIAIEPVGETYQRLRRNIELNQFTHVSTFRMGLGENPGERNIFPCEPNNCGSNSFYSKSSNEPLEKVAVIDGDSLLDSLNINHVKLCKIDVEGAEVDVLSGLDTTLRKRKVRNLMIEANEQALSRAGRSVEELMAALREYGFTLTDIKSGRLIDDSSNVTDGLNLLCSLA